MSLTIEQIVENGLCIGCGLCRSIAGSDRIAIVTTPEGRERPLVTGSLNIATLDRINAVCPGTRVEVAASKNSGPDTKSDLIWGTVEKLAIGYAGEPAVRHQASTGGVLTALSQYLLKSGRVKFILHVAASRSEPMRSERRLSFDSASILEAAGSRYGPAAPLIDFLSILDRDEPFALVAKPCDITAVRNLGRLDARVEANMRYALTLVCGGASDLTKSEDVLSDLGMKERDLALFRYRGYGNPGMTRIETKDDRVFELTYQKMWEQESTWMIQPRCKICPDAIGESADIVASDVWPGGGPSGDDAGFNGIIVRNQRGLELYHAAVSAGAIVVDPQEVGFADFNHFQPHQVRKKRAVWARLAGLKAAGRPIPLARNLRIEECARTNTHASNLAEARAASRRARSGKLGEPKVVRRPHSKLIEPPA